MLYVEDVEVVAVVVDFDVRKLIVSLRFLAHKIQLRWDEGGSMLTHLQLC